MTEKEFEARYAEKENISAYEANKRVNAFKELMCEIAMEDESVTLHGWGRFENRTRTGTAKVGGLSYPYTTKRQAFKVSEKLKDKLNAE